MHRAFGAPWRNGECRSRALEAERMAPHQLFLVPVVLIDNWELETRIWMAFRDGQGHGLRQGGRIFVGVSFGVRAQAKPEKRGRPLPRYPRQTNGGTRTAPAKTGRTVTHEKNW